MKIKSLALLLALLGLVVGLAPRTASAQDEVSFNFFYDSLKPYGDWIQVGNYGLCWHPAGVAAEWAPYTDGYWSYTDGGWTWVSYEDYGGVVYHYGRWIDTDQEGWCWVPDYQWAPAWVSWRSSDDYIGWAPLPPECSWQPEVGVSVWCDTTYDIGPGWFHFCHYADFGAPVLTAVILPRRENVTFISSTVNITNITINRGSGLIFVGGPHYDVVARRVGRPIPTLKLVQQTNVTNIFAEGKRPLIQTLQKGNALYVPAPHMRPVADPTALLHDYKPTKVIAAEHVGRGWGVVQNPEQRDQIRKTFLTQAKGRTPQTTPARAFDPAELKAVPKKVNEAAVVSGGEKRHEGGPLKPGEAIEPVTPKGITENPGKQEHEKKFDKPPIVSAEPVEGGKIERDKPLKPVVNGQPENLKPIKKFNGDERPVGPGPDVIKRPGNDVVEDRRPPSEPKFDARKAEVEKEQKFQEQKVQEQKVQKEQLDARKGELEREQKLQREKLDSERVPKGPPQAPQNPNGNDKKDKGKRQNDQNN